MKTLTKAICFAAEKHEGQTRKGTDIPYITHPMEAGAIAATLTDDEEIIAAAVLHDVVEDCGVTGGELTVLFGERVASLVAADSEDKRESLPAADTWKIRKEETIERFKTSPKEVKMLTLGDKLSNIRSICRDYEAQGDALWQRFNQKDKNEHRWYYKSLADCLSDLCEYPAYKEYVFLAEKTFGE